MFKIPLKLQVKVLSSEAYENIKTLEKIGVDLDIEEGDMEFKDEYYTHIDSFYEEGNYTVITSGMVESVCNIKIEDFKALYNKHINE